MKNVDNIKVLDEANKGCCMGRDALEVIMEKTDNSLYYIWLNCVKTLKNTKDKVISYVHG